VSDTLELPFDGEAQPHIQFVAGRDMAAFCAAHPHCHIEVVDGGYECHIIGKSNAPGDLDQPARFTYDTNPVYCRRMAFARGGRRGE